jgi:hypothetical protein
MITTPKKTKSVAIASAILAIQLLAPARASPSSLCSTDERAVFSCALSNGKTVSICRASSNRSITYRFGKPTPSSVELEFSGITGLHSPFFTAQYVRPLTGFFSFGFRTKGYEYRIYSDFDDEEDARPLRRGLVVRRGGIVISDMKCVSDIVDTTLLDTKDIPCKEDEFLGCGDGVDVWRRPDEVLRK